MKKINKYFDIIYGILTLLCGFLFYNSYLHMHFATDTYCDLYDLKDIIRGLKLNGRFLSYYMAKTLDFFGINTVYPAKNQFITFSIVILILSFVSFFTYKMLKTEYKAFELPKKILLGLCVLTMYFNVLFCDLLQFAECSLFFVVGFIFAVFAVYVTFKTKIKFCLRIVLGTILLALTSFCYQPLINYYIMISALFCIARTPSFGSSITSLKKIQYRWIPSIQNIVFIPIYGFVGVFNALLMKIVLLDSSRVLSSPNLVQNIKNVVKFQYDALIKNYNLLPPFIFALCLLCAIIFLIIGFYYKNATVSAFVFITTMLIIVYASIYLPLLISSGNQSFWPSPRGYTLIMAMPGVISIVGLKFYKGGKYIILPIVAVFAVLILNMHGANNIGADMLYTNNRDFESARVYIQEFEKYEEKSGTEITKIFFNTDGASDQYDSVIGSYDINVNAFMRNWSRIHLLNFVAGSKIYSEVNIYQVDEKFVKSQKEEIVYDGDTAYIMIK